MNRELYDYQQEAIDALRDTFRGNVRRVVCALPTGGGKCLGIGTPVLKFDGSIVAVETIRPGDVLMGPDSAPRRVLTTCRGIGSLYKIVPTRGDPWVCNDVHVLTLVETESGGVIDIPLNEYIGQSKWFKHVHKQFAPKNGVEFARKSDPDVPGYFLGLWIGDGTKALKSVQISKPDIEVQEECERIALANGGYLHTTFSYNGCPTYHISTPRGQPNRLLDKMRELVGNGDIPLSVRTASRAYREQVLAGIIDTDGHIHNGSCEIAQRSETLADGLMFIARSLGLKATCSDKIVNGTIYKRIGLSGDLFAIPTRIARKSAAPRRQKKIATRTGFAVEPAGLGEYAGFELDGDGRFLLGDFTVTHNTMIASAIIERANELGQRTTFVVPSISLIDQTYEKFRAEGLDDIGVIQANHPMTNFARRNQICSIQTLKSRGYFPDSKLIIFDEVHQLHDHHKKWLTDPKFARAYFVGLSATPWTKGLGLYFDTLLIAADMQDLIDKGRLSKYRIFACPKADVSGVKITAGDYQVDQLSKASQKGTLTADIVHTWQTKWGQDKTLVFCVDCAHAQVIHERFMEAGIRSAYQDASTTGVDREDIRRGFHSGGYQVVCNVGTLTTGVDWDVRCLSFARPTKSEMLYVQIIGRALRTAEGKEWAMILDHTDTTMELTGGAGPVGIHHDRLDHRADNAKDPPVERKPAVAKPCPACAALGMRIARVCQNCGHEFPLHTTVENEDGELTELVPGRMIPAGLRGAKRVYSDEEKLRWYQEALGWCREHGKKDGLAWHLMQEKFGPTRVSTRGQPPISPSWDVDSYIRSRFIRYAKGKAKEAATA